jgi:hypothetical protein
MVNRSVEMHSNYFPKLPHHVSLRTVLATLLITVVWFVAPLATKASEWGVWQSFSGHSGVEFRVRCDDSIPPDTDGRYVWYVEFRNHSTVKETFSFRITRAGDKPSSFSSSVTVNPGSTAGGPNQFNLVDQSPDGDVEVWTGNWQPDSNCAEALEYVNDPDGLEKDLNDGVNRLNIHSEGLRLQQNVKDELLSDSWWATSSGPVVAAQIKVITDEVQDWVSIIYPEEAKLKQAQKNLINALKVSAEAIKAAYENRASVRTATQAAIDAAVEKLDDIAKEEGKESLAEKLKLGPAYGTYNSLKDAQDYVKTLDDAGKSREMVQEQIRRLDKQISQIRSKVSIDAQEIEALNSLKMSVEEACIQKPVYIKPLQ